MSRQYATIIEGRRTSPAFGEAGDGATGGDAHIVSITAVSVIDLFPKASNSIYVTGGFGFYHKSTNFNTQECCDFYGYPETVNVNSFTADQIGTNLGVGFSHRVGNASYGDSTMRIFAEARYLFVNTPSICQTNGLGATELIPVTFGVRW